MGKKTEKAKPNVLGFVVAILIGPSLAFIAWDIFDEPAVARALRLPAPPVVQQRAEPVVEPIIKKEDRLPSVFSNYPPLPEAPASYPDANKLTALIQQESALPVAKFRPHRVAALKKESPQPGLLARIFGGTKTADKEKKPSKKHG